ncbi:hypothetical protein GGR56DRAFT_44586 [Xylariaceae sp. FL0804]|nr:hypothetical protein GGR56DRAFT_44586 [Xylariaceae sp. FL0804]
MPSYNKVLGTVIASLGIAPLARAQGFINNCTWETGFMSGSFLGMYCNDDDWADFSYDWTWFDTNLCIINNGGQLHPYDNGNYWASCVDCFVEGSPVEFILNCTCYNIFGQTEPASIDLNTVLINLNGTLDCYDHFGNETQVGPF